MGGCRCAFRDCPVGTCKFPGMHFFHFPINDPERYIRWLSLADTMQYLEMPLTFQRNRVVCARHFRVECFKNYRRDRIMPKKSVEPTLMPLNEDMALDYSKAAENGGPELIKIPICTIKHLIPPPSYTFPFTLHDNLIPSEYIAKKNITLGNPDEAKLQSKKRNWDAAKEVEDTKIPKKMKILNSEARSIPSTTREITLPHTIMKIDIGDNCSMLDLPVNSDANILQEELDEATAFDDEQYDLVQHETCVDERDIEIQDNILLNEDYEDLMKQLEDKDEEGEETMEEMAERIKQLEEELEKSREELKNKTNTLNSTKTELRKVKTKLKAHENELELKNKSSEENLRLQKENAQLREKCKEYEKQNKQKEINGVTTSQATSSVVIETAAASRRQPAATANNALSKAQLFNGVKKYISSSMLALLRMEMFASADRNWKPDERRVAIDLLQLGEEVYKYISDEWRFRLPAMAEVRLWLDDATNSVDDEEDL
ncbi:PH domain-containing protein DDB_G0287875 [Anastrepha ludens]|uniref:PH domain-containing protein DDB_G0287875 n=1 Tax=Anastrepha ludens TaxID=28586 RepID=UPI0023B1809F|nr:PH domain-containing protein DDB_G0287875 [Anastrepha ludens]